MPAEIRHAATTAVIGGPQWNADHSWTPASQAQAEAGSANDEIMTPLRTAQAIAARSRLTPMPAFRIQAGYWVHPMGVGAGGGNNIAGTPNNLFSLPIVNAHLIDAIGLEVIVAAAGALGRVGIYNTDDNLLPTDLLFASGELDFSTTGSKIFSLGSSHRITRPIWLVLQTNGVAATLRAGQNPNGNMTAAAMGGSAQTSAINCPMFQASRAYAALPTTHPGLGTHQANTNALLLSARLA